MLILEIIQHHVGLIIIFILSLNNELGKKMYEQEVDKDKTMGKTMDKNIYIFSIYLN